MKVFLCSIFVFVYLIGAVQAATVTTFSSPENSYSVISNYLSGLTKSAYLSVYTFTNLGFAGQLVEASKRGVDIKVIVEDSPVGEEVERGVLCFLQNNGVEVYLYKGRLKFLHAKYIVGDNRSVVVSSENFVDDGFYKNRGWGAVIEDEYTAGELLQAYITDLKDSGKIKCDGETRKIEAKPTEKIKLYKYEDQEVDLIVAPDAVEKILDLLESANKSIYIEQFYIYRKWGSSPNIFLEKVIEGARNGVDVKILLDSNYYNTEKSDHNSNYYTVEYIKNISTVEKIPIEAKLVDLKSLGFSKIHTKGVIIDNKSVLVSSINWNENSPRNNREVGITITGDSVAYFLDKFLHDWGQGSYSELSSSKLVGKDYGQTIANIFLFIIVVSIVMILIKRRFYRRSKVSI